MTTQTEDVITIYKCQNKNCQAEDRDRGNNPPAPQTLNCWKCKGKGSMFVERTEPRQ